MKQSRRYCRSCGRKTLHGKAALGAGWGLLLSLLTGGLFVPVWAGMGLWRAVFKPWRCQDCGAAKLL